MRARIGVARGYAHVVQEARVTLQIIIWVAIGVAVAAASLFLFILISRIREATSERRYAKRRDDLLPVFYRYICGDASVEQIRGSVRAARAVAQDLILAFLKQLSDGEARNRLLAAADELGFLQSALRDLRSMDWAKRDIAAMNLGILGLRETVADLVGLLRDRRVEVRYTAARSLGLIGTHEAVQALISIMDQPELLDTPRVLEIVHSMGAQASEPLRQLLGRNGHRPDVKLLAIDLIGDLREYSMVGELHDQLRSLNTEEALRAVRALGKISAPQSTRDVLRLAVDRSWAVRAQAVKAIGQLEIDEGLTLLLDALNDESYWVRFNAAQALVTLGDAGVRILAKARWTTDKFARDVAQYQIERLNGKFELLGIDLPQEVVQEEQPASPAAVVPSVRRGLPSVSTY
jgi:HEAT repeat protein